ncbi:MAG: secretion protein HlyD [Desulforhopalus sp.]
MKKAMRIVGLLIIMVALGAGVIYLKQEKQSDHFALYGNVDIREVDLGFRVSGKLLEMRFEEGDTVKQGDILATLDAEPYQNELEAADARVDRANALLDKFEKGSRPQEIKSGKAQVEEAQAAYNNALRDFNRQTDLFATKATSRKSVDQAQARHDETRARLQSAMEALALLEEGFRSEDIVVSRQELREARARYETAKTRLQDTRLISPNDGILITRIQEPGTILAAGAPVYTMLLRNPIYIRAYVAEPDLGNIAPGTAVEITTDSTDTIYQGRIGFISPRAEFTPKNVETADLRTDLVYRLRIIAEDTDNGLRQGMPVTIRLQNNNRAN